MFAGSSGRWAQLFNAGLDNPAFRALMAKGLRLTKSVAQAPAIAEYVMANVISLWHPLETQRRLQAEHAWASTPFREMSNSRWLMVGFGAIGGEIARRLQPFGAALTVVRRQVGDHPLASDVRALADLKELLPDADVVVLACALNEETRQIANTAFFAAMKPGAILVNIGRGGLVHEAALRAGLDQGRPGMAVLDVFEQEPLAPDAWFWDHPNIRMTAHCSNAGDGVVARGDRFFLENLKLYLEGRPLLHEADKSEVGL
jgi:phosphoglycerate dehydrogenase-like enzyme